jgi:hypothetical protein
LFITWLYVKKHRHLPASCFTWDIDNSWGKRIQTYELMIHECSVFSCKYQWMQWTVILVLFHICNFFL